MAYVSLYLNKGGQLVKYKGLHIRKTVYTHFPGKPGKTRVSRLCEADKLSALQYVIKGDGFF